MKILKRIGLVIAVTVVLLGFDLATKEVARMELKGQQTISYLGGTVKLIYAENIGGMLSMGSSVSEGFRFVVFRVFVSIVLIILFVYMVLKDDLNKWQLAAMILVLGGGIGNLLNRFFNDGRVIDFMVLELFGVHTGIFNLADIYVTLGISYLLISSLLSKYMKNEDSGETPGPS